MLLFRLEIQACFETTFLLSEIHMLIISSSENFLVESLKLFILKKSLYSLHSWKLLCYNNLGKMRVIFSLYNVNIIHCFAFTVTEAKSAISVIDVPLNANCVFTRIDFKIFFSLTSYSFSIPLAWNLWDIWICDITFALFWQVSSHSLNYLFQYGLCLVLSHLSYRNSISLC